MNKVKKDHGRPTSYKTEFDEQAKSLALLGLTDSQMSKFFNVAESTFHLWKKEHPSFSESLSSGKINADAKVAESLYKSALGLEVEEKTIEKTALGTKTKITKRQLPPDMKAVTLWLKNRQPEKWRDKVELDHTSPDGSMTPTMIERVVIYNQNQKEEK